MAPDEPSGEPILELPAIREGATGDLRCEGSGLAVTPILARQQSNRLNPGPDAQRATGKEDVIVHRARRYRQPAPDLSRREAFGR
jgi:hypothetical protein